MWQVSASGGDPRPLIDLDPENEIDFHDVSLLPDGKSVLFVPHLLEPEAVSGSEQRQIDALVNAGIGTDLFLDCEIG